MQRLDSAPSSSSMLSTENVHTRKVVRFDAAEEALADDRLPLEASEQLKAWSREPHSSEERSEDHSCTVLMSQTSQDSRLSLEDSRPDYRPVTRVNEAASLASTQGPQTPSQREHRQRDSNDEQTSDALGTPCDNARLPLHRRLWSWGWSSSSSASAINQQQQQSHLLPRDQIQRHYPGDQQQLSGRGSSEDRRRGSPQADVQTPIDPVAWSGKFPIARGGVVVFTLPAMRSFTVTIASDCQAAAQQQAWLGARIGANSAELVLGQGPSLRVLTSTHFKGAGYGHGERSTFWVSFDPDNCTVKYGKGSRMAERTLLCYTFTKKACDQFGIHGLRHPGGVFGPEPKLIQLLHYEGPPVVEHSLFEAPLMGRRSDRVASVMFDSQPLVYNPSPRLLSDSQRKLDDYSLLDYTFPASLAPVGQALAAQVMQARVSLDRAGEGPSLAAAIAHSLQTPGAFLHTLLEAKIAALPMAIPCTQTHLTVALAPCQGASLGVPFSLEIFPGGHSSSIRSHANSHGILRLLHGFADVCLYDGNLAEAEEGSPLDEVDMDPGGVFWFSPQWYQTHQIRNESREFCCFLRATQYADEDCVHWAYVHYKGPDAKVCAALPSFDCNFLEMRATVLAEYEAARKRDPSLSKESTEDEAEEDVCMSRTQSWVATSETAYELLLPSDVAPCHDVHQARFSCGPFRRARASRQPRSFMFDVPDGHMAPESLAMMWP